MSDPFLDHKDPILGALSEVISAMSALNMEPSPVDPPPPDRDGHRAFLSEADEWAKHAMTHLNAAVTLCNRATVMRETARHETDNLVRRAREAAAVLERTEAARALAEKDRADFLVAVVILFPFFFPGLDPDVKGDRDATNPEWVQAAKYLMPLLQPEARVKLEAAIASAPPLTKDSP